MQKVLRSEFDCNDKRRREAVGIIRFHCVPLVLDFLETGKAEKERERDGTRMGEHRCSMLLAIVSAGVGTSVK